MGQDLEILLIDETNFLAHLASNLNNGDKWHIDHAQCYQSLKSYFHYDLIILDVSLLEESTIRTLGWIEKASKYVPIVISAHFTDLKGSKSNILSSAFKAGAKKLLPRSLDRAEDVRAVLKKAMTYSSGQVLENKLKEQREVLHAYGFNK